MFIRVGAAVLILTLGLAGGARAEDDSGCDKFKWSIARERAWFAASPKPIAAGDTLTTTDQGYLATLVPSESVRFALPPERALKPGTFGGTLEITLNQAGPYQITLSQEAWVDVVQGGALVKSTAFSGQKNCPGVRKSVKFDFAAGPATLQISNSETDKLMLAAAPAP